MQHIEHSYALRGYAGSESYVAFNMHVIEWSQLRQSSFVFCLIFNEN